MKCDVICTIDLLATPAQAQAQARLKPQRTRDSGQRTAGPGSGQRAPACFSPAATPWTMPVLSPRHMLRIPKACRPQASTFPHPQRTTILWGCELPRENPRACPSEPDHPRPFNLISTSQLSSRPRLQSVFCALPRPPRRLPTRSHLRPFSNSRQSSLPVLAKLFEILSQPAPKTVPMPPSPTLSGFLERNEQFASSCDPDLLASSCKGQSPSVFWLGCSDSRVPEGVVIRAGVGEVFVHRNVANVFHPDDTSATAALAYAVNHLKVKHVVVVGHESCGGCAAALAAASAPPASAPPADVGEAAIARWIGPIKALAASHLAKGPLDLPDLVAANVKTQVKNVVEHEVIKKAWARDQPISVHGWVYDLASGKVTDLGLTQSCPTV